MEPKHLLSWIDPISTADLVVIIIVPISFMIPALQSLENVRSHLKYPSLGPELWAIFTWWTQCAKGKMAIHKFTKVNVH